MNVRHILAVAAAASLLAAGIVACGDDDKKVGGTGTPAATKESASAPSNATLVTAKDFEISPKIVQVQKNAEVTITFKNEGAATHTFTVYDDSTYGNAVPGADSGRVEGGKAGDLKVRMPQNTEWYYRCEIHPDQMHGNVQSK